MRTIVLLTLALASAAVAADPKHEAAEDKARTVPGGASKGVQACHDDIERWCAGVKPGEGRLGRCLKKSSKKLSKACRRWTQHGGLAHVDRAFMEIDQSTAAPTAAPRPPATESTR